MRVRALLALVLGIVAAAVIGCGGSSSSLLSQADSAGLKDELANVQTALDNGQCAQATRAAASFETAARNLPTSVDPALRENIRQGAAQLVAQVPPDCRKQKTVTTETTTTTNTTPTTTATTPTTTTPTVPTIPSTLPTTPSTTPSGTGGTGAGTGGSSTP